jgi:hypothetical protein
LRSTAGCRGIRLLEMWTVILAPWERRPILRALAACRAWPSKNTGSPSHRYRKVLSSGSHNIAITPR